MGPLDQRTCYQLKNGNGQFNTFHKTKINRSADLLYNLVQVTPKWDTGSNMFFANEDTTTQI